MVSKPISGLTQVAFKPELLIPAIDPTAGVGLKNVSVAASSLPTVAAATLIWSGTVLPSNELGNNGDFYILTQNGVVTFLGPKADGVWPESGTVLNGPPGPEGTDYPVTSVAGLGGAVTTTQIATALGLTAPATAPFGNQAGQVADGGALAAASAVANAAIPSTTLGQPLGPVQADSTNKVPLANLPASVIGSNHYLGTWNAATNTPTLASSTAPAGSAPVGGYYIVSVAGTRTIDGDSVWNVGDWILWSGTVWEKLDGQANPVSSVAGLQGAVSGPALSAALGLTAPATAPFGNQAGQVADGAALAAASAVANAAIPSTTLGQPLGPVQADSTNKVPLANLPASVIGSNHYLGTWNAATNTPTLASSTAPAGSAPVGGYYVVSAAGTPTINGISVWNVGDWIIWGGTVWEKLDGQANPVSSVAGLQGAVSGPALSAALGLTAPATAPFGNQAGQVADGGALAAASAVANAAIPGSTLNQALGPLEIDAFGNISSAMVLANGAEMRFSLAQLCQLQFPLLNFFGGQAVAHGATTGFDNSLVLSGNDYNGNPYTNSPLGYMNAFLSTVNDAPFLVEFGGKYFATSQPWTPPANCSPNNGGLLALPGTGAGWQSNIIIAASWNSSTQQTTYTTASPHGLSAGASIIINGSSPGKYDVGPVPTLAGTTGNAIVVAATSNPGTYNTSYPGALVNAVMMITNSGVSPTNFKVNCNQNAYWGYIVTATSGIAPQSVSGTSWPTNPGDYNHGGMLVSGGKLNGPGPYNFSQYSTAANPQNWSGAGIRFSGCADTKANNLVANYCGHGIHIDYGTFACTFSNGHPFNGGNGTTIQNQVNVYYEGYDCVFEGFEQDSGAFLCVVSSLQNHQSPAGPRALFLGSNWFYNSANASYPSLIRVRSTQPNTSLTGLVIGDELYQPGNAIPIISCESYGAQTGTGVSPAVTSVKSITLTSKTGTLAIGNQMEALFGVPGQTYLTNVAGNTITFNNPVTLAAGTVLTFTATTGTWASSVPASWIASAANSPVGSPTSNFSMNGVDWNIGSNLNGQGFFYLKGYLKNPRVAGQGGTLSVPGDSNGAIAANQVNTPVVLSATATYGTALDVTSIASGGTAITAAPITVSGNSANVGNTAVGSVSFGAGAPPGGYLVTALTSTTSSIVDPSGTNLGTATLGTPFVSSEINLTLTAGSTTQVAGDVNTVINNAGTATLNGVAGGSLQTTGPGKVTCFCIANGTGTAAVWVASGSIVPSQQISWYGPGVNYAIQTSDFFNGVVAVSPNVALTLPNNALKGTGLFLASTSTGTTILGASAGTLGLPNNAIVWAEVVTNSSGTNAAWLIQGNAIAPTPERDVTIATDAVLQTDNGGLISYVNGATAVAVSIADTLLQMDCDLSVEGTGIVTWTMGATGYLNGVLGGSYSSQGQGTQYRLTIQRNSSGSVARAYISVGVSQPIVTTSAGSASSGSILALNASGKVDSTALYVGQAPGTATNDNASAGNLGEYLSSNVPVGSAVSLTTGTPANVTSLVLTAGDWDVSGNVAFTPGGTTTSTQQKVWISATSATLPTQPNAGGESWGAANPAAGMAAIILPVGPMRFQVPNGSTTNVYLSAIAAFSVSTMTVNGFFRARRMR